MTEYSLDRNRLFALLTALEGDLRDVIENELLRTHYEEQVLGDCYVKASDRRDRDRNQDARLLDYIDLSDAIELLQRWRDSLGPDHQVALKDSASELATLVGVRNRVMHGRPLLPDDLLRAQQAVQRAIAFGFAGPAVKKVVQTLRSDPGWSPPISDVGGGGQALNNLPLPDFDETGLVGRNREVADLTAKIAALPESRGGVLTVVGPGGIGKTALVLQALHDVVSGQECPYDLVSWVSLKTERLTAAGVESIRDAIISLDQAMPAFVEAIDSEFDGTVEQLADSLDGVSALIVIDNLETVTGEEVVEFVNSMPRVPSIAFELNLTVQFIAETASKSPVMLLLASTGSELSSSNAVPLSPEMTLFATVADAPNIRTTAEAAP